MELLWHNTDSLPEHGDLFLTSGTSQQLESENAALKEENERLKAEKNSIGAKLVGSRLAVGQLKARVADYEEALADKRSLTRELDILLNGDSAAKQASLCDIISQLSQHKTPILARVAELEERTRIHITLQEIADLANLAIGQGDEVTIGDNHPETEIVIYQDVTLDNEDGTCTTWPLAFYWVDCPEEGFTGIGDDPGAKPIKESANEG